MSAILSSLLLAALAAPQAELSALNGDSHRGELKSLSAATVLLQAESGEVQLPIAELLELRLDAASPANGGVPAPFAAELVGGSKFSCRDITTAGRVAKLATSHFGTTDVPVSGLANLRFQSAEGDILKSWQELCARELKRDLLVIKKQGDVTVLDHLDGIVGEIDAKHIKFLLDGDEIPVNRDKVFGVIYSRREPAPSKPVCEAHFAGPGPELVQLRSVVFDGQQFTGETVFGGAVTIDPVALKSLDYSLGKVRYLSQMEFRDYKHTPYFDREWNLQKDRDDENRPLKLGQKIYKRGLWIHSRTSVTYRLAGEYRRFLADAGMSSYVTDGRAHVTLQILADGKPLFESGFRMSDKPQPLDLDVTNVRDLQIFVDYGNFLDVSDWIVLGDARVTK